MKLIYMAHPVGGPDEWAANLARAKRWLAWLLATSSIQDDMVYVCPWLHELELGPRTWEREAILARCEAVAARCDGLVLVGGRISEGMRREAAAAPEVLDLTHLGDEPPEET